MPRERSAATEKSDMDDKIKVMHVNIKLKKEDQRLRKEDHLAMVKKFVRNPGAHNSTTKAWLRYKDEAMVHAGDASDLQESISAVTNLKTTAGVKYFAEQSYYPTASTDQTVNVLTAGLMCALSNIDVTKQLAQDLMAQYSDDQLYHMQMQHGFESRAQVACLLVNEYADLYAQQSNLASELLKSRAKGLAAQTQADMYEDMFQQATQHAHADPFLAAATSGKYALPGASPNHALPTTTNTTTRAIPFEELDDTDEEIDADTL